jgi:hypothetical protein
MDEREKIQQQLPELAKARVALLDLKPPDINGFQQLSRRIGELQRRLVAIVGAPTLPTLSPEEVARLRGAVQSLQTAVTASAGATQIMQAATKLLNS